jgi:hypothetical protein
MGVQTLTTAALVLDRAASGESWLRLKLLSAEHGLVDCLQRLARRTAAQAPALDLFDEAQVVLESRNQGRSWFVREALVVHRRSGLGASYPALRAACRLARVITGNPVPDESRATVMALLRRALDAWERGPRPDAIYFKTLFLLARDEGHPVREEWWPRLRSEDRAAAESVLRRTAAAQEVDEPVLARLSQALEDYLRGTAGFAIDD